MSKNLVKIADLFMVKYGNSLELINLIRCNQSDIGAIPFISRTEKNNGVSSYVEKDLDIEINPAHTLTVAVGGSVLSTFYQPVPFYTGFHVLILIPKKKINTSDMLFYAKCISSNKYKYNYGRQANKTLKDILIPESVPKNLKTPLLSFYKKQLVSISKDPLLEKDINLNSQKWDYFLLSDLFDVKGSKTTSLADLERDGDGPYPYITTQATNNGAASFHSFQTEDGGVLTIDSAVLGYCSYQDIPFSASDHVEKLIPKFKMDKYIAIFLVTILNREQYRYNYGEKGESDKVEETRNTTTIKRWLTRLGVYEELHSIVTIYF